MKLPTKARQLPEHTDAPLIERNINMSNAITRSAQGFTLAQKRVVALALAKTDSIPAQHQITGMRYGFMVRLTAADYAATYEVDPTTAYEQLKGTAITLLKCLWRTEPEGKSKQVIAGQWLSMARYADGAGVVDIVFHPMVTPHLLNLRSQFTTIKLKQVAALRSIYAWRLFECLKSWQTTGKWKPSLEDFAHTMEAPASYKTDFGQIKRWIIEPAIKELKTKQGLIVEYKTIKAGRKVLELEFTFHQDPQACLEL